MKACLFSDRSNIWKCVSRLIFTYFFYVCPFRYALLELGTDPKKWHKNFKVLAMMMKPKPVKNKLMKTWKVWQYWLWSFQGWDTKLERFLAENQLKSLNFTNWCNGEVSSSAKICLSKSIFYIKNHPNLPGFFYSLKNKNLGAHFLLLTFFDNINF